MDADEIWNWAAVLGMTQVSVPETWWIFATRMIKETLGPSRTKFGIPMPTMVGFKAHIHLFSERNPKLYKSARRLEQRGI